MQRIAGQFGIFVKQARIFRIEPFPLLFLAKLFEPFAAQPVDHRRIFRPGKKILYRACVGVFQAEAQPVITGVHLQRRIFQPLRETLKLDRIAGAEGIARREKIRSLVRQRGRGNQQAKIKEEPHRNPSKKQSR